LITAAVANEFVELESDVSPVSAMARIVGKYSGFAPAITALMATCFTVNCQSGYDPRAGDIFPTISSGLWLVPFSMAVSRSSVGRTICMKSVIPLSR
jgi:hypothetical protein